jgi:hypothetical protein
VETRRWSLAIGIALSVGASTCGGQGTELKDLINPSADGGVAGGSDGNAPPTAYTDPFAGAPAYASKQGTSAHNAGKACMPCHATGGSAGADRVFLIGGTVYNDYKGTTPAVGAEVRVLDTGGHAVSAYSDSTGNFFIYAKNANSVVFPAVVGVRDAATKRPMIAQLTAAAMGSCGQTSCHDSNDPMHVP